MNDLSGQTIENYQLQTIIRETSCTQLYHATGTRGKILLLYVLQTFSFTLTDSIDVSYADVINDNHTLQSAINQHVSGSGYVHVLNIVKSVSPEKSPNHQPYLIYESIDKGELLSAFKQIEPEQITRLFWNIADGLRFAHHEGVIHGALHSDNIMIRPLDMKPKIFGFRVRSALRGYSPRKSEDCKALVMMLYAMRKGIPFHESAMNRLLNDTHLDFTGIPRKEEILIKNVLYGKDYAEIESIIREFEAIYPQIFPKKDSDSVKTAPVQQTIRRPATKPQPPKKESPHSNEAETLPADTIQTKPKTKVRPADSPKPDINIPISSSGELSPIERQLIERALQTSKQGNEQMKIPKYLKERFKPFKEKTLRASNPYPNQEVYQRLCKLQSWESEPQFTDGTVIGKGSYGTVIYRKRGTIETAQKIYDITEILDDKAHEGNVGENLEFILQSIENEYCCQADNHNLSCIVKFYPEYSTPKELVCFLHEQVSFFNQLADMDAQHDLIKLRKLQEEAHRSRRLKPEWIDALVLAFSKGHQPPNLKDWIHPPDYLILETEFGLSFLYFMYWFQQMDMYPEQALNVIYDLFEMLNHISKSGIIHMDLKPSNLLLVKREGNLVPVAIDFNTSHRSHTAHLWGTDTIIHSPHGTPLYMPDYWQKQDETINATIKIDVFAVALISCQLLDNIALSPKSLTSNRKKWQQNANQPTRLTELGSCATDLWRKLLYPCLNTNERECPTSKKAFDRIASIKDNHSNTYPIPNISNEELLVNEIKNNPGVCDEYYHYHTFEPHNPAVNSAYPTIEEYYHLCIRQISSDYGDDLVDNDWVFFPENCILRYQNRHSKRRLQFIYAIFDDEDSIFGFKSVFEFTNQLMMENHSSVVQLDLEHSTWISSLDSAYNHKTSLPYVILDMEFGLLYQHYLMWLHKTSYNYHQVMKIMHDIALALREIYNTADYVSDSDDSCTLGINNLMLVRRNGTYQPAFFALSEGDFYHGIGVIHSLGNIFGHIMNGKNKNTLSLSNAESKCFKALEDCQKYNGKKDVCAFLDDMIKRLQ